MIRLKGNRKRRVPLHPEAKAVLLNLLKKDKYGKYVFCKEDGSPYSIHHYYRHFHAAQERAGFTKRYRFHDLRHTFASHFMMSGGELYELKNLLGHSSIEMTQKYAHLSPNHLNKSIRVLDLLSGKPKLSDIFALNDPQTTQQNES